MPLIRTTIDFETAYGTSPSGQQVTLSKMTTEHYIRHPEFKVHGLGVQIENEPPFYLYGRELLHFLKTHPWDRSLVIGHHQHFDGAILSWRLGIRAAFYGCTLSMARAVYPHESDSLANLSKLLGLGEKGFELASFKDKWTLDDEEQAVLGRYCCNDVSLTYKIFDALRSQFPLSELRLIDWTVRAFTEPVVCIDPQPLVVAYAAEKRRKRALVQRCVTDKVTLASGDKFAALLLSLGIDPPKKLSPSKIKDGRVDPDTVGEPPLGLLPSFKAWRGITPEEKAQLKKDKNRYPWAYAFGKSDEAFKLLLDHPDPQVQAVVEARLGAKSTITETRAKRFYKIGKRGRFPVYLKYYGAHSGRWCLAGDTQIFIVRGGEVLCILLPDLRPDDMVWDGEEFVTHGGLVCRGQQEVITYDGITGTPTHKVFCEESPSAISLSRAQEGNYTLKVARAPTDVDCPPECRV